MCVMCFAGLASFGHGDPVGHDVPDPTNIFLGQFESSSRMFGAVARLFFVFSARVLEFL